MLKTVLYLLGMASMLRSSNASVFVKLGDETVDIAKNLANEVNDNLYQFDDDLNFYDRRGKSIKLNKNEPALTGRKLHYVAHGGTTSYTEIFTNLYDSVNEVTPQSEVFLYGCHTEKYIKSLSTHHSSTLFTGTKRSISHDGIQTVTPTKSGERSTKTCKAANGMRFPCQELQEKDTVKYKSGTQL